MNSSHDPLEPSPRPVFHFTPPRNWLNDPNGLVYFQGEYHLFYQHNPLGDTWGNMSWGHATTRDFLTWEHHGVAIPVSSDVMAFSGCAVVDWQNSSGFGTDDEPPLVIVYTGHRDQPAVQDQRLAYSTDRGRTWTLHAHNPVLEIGARDFRDPKVFWHAPTRRWVMIVTLSRAQKVQIYTALDLKHWTLRSEFGPFGDPTDIWEVPDLFKLHVEDSHDTRWALKVDIIQGDLQGESAGQYFIGHFDGERFTLDETLENQPLRLEGGKDFYAAITWSDLPTTDGRCLWIAWMSNWQYAKHTPTRPWRGALTVPRSLHLERDTMKLLQRPVRELERLRGTPSSVNALTLANEHHRLTMTGTTLEIVAEFNLGTAKEFGICVRIGSTARTVIGFDTTTATLFVDRRQSGQVNFDQHFPARLEATESLRGTTIRMHLLIDHSSVEVFGNDGRSVITALIFPDPRDDGLEVYAEGGTVELVSLQVWTLGSR
jgi:fructan beta-fructosidase